MEAPKGPPAPSDSAVERLDQPRPPKPLPPRPAGPRKLGRGRRADPLRLACFLPFPSPFYPAPAGCSPPSPPSLPPRVAGVQIRALEGAKAGIGQAQRLLPGRGGGKRLGIGVGGLRGGFVRAPEAHRAAQPCWPRGCRSARWGCCCCRRCSSCSSCRCPSGRIPKPAATPTAATRSTASRAASSTPGAPAGSWGGNLATLKRAEEAAQVSQLLAGSRRPGPPRLFWIGLQRQPRQCFPQRPLRGFSWVTGEQETAYSNWARAGPAVGTPGAGCAAPRCVALDDRDFQWLEGSCAGPVDGYLCRFAFRGMCAGLEEGEAVALRYAAPFGPLAAAVGAPPPRFVPFGTVASVGCPGGASLSLLCLQKEDGRPGWSKSGPLCREPSGAALGFGLGRRLGVGVQLGSGYACECHAGFALLPDGRSCAARDPCRHRPCQFDCVAEEAEEEEESGDGYRCRCPAGYELASDGHRCEDSDECLEAPCEHQCENTEGSYLCRCHLGFSPAEDEPGQCVDTDECQIPGVCQQMCVNYVGGFECYCTEGFDLEADGISCSPLDGLAPAGPDATPPELWADPFHVRFTTRQADEPSAPPVRFSLFRDGETGSSESAASFLSLPDRLVFPPPPGPAATAPELDSAWDSSPLEQAWASPGQPEVLHPTPAASRLPPLLTSSVGSLPVGVTGEPRTTPPPPPPGASAPSEEKVEPVVEGVRAPLPTFATPGPASEEEGGQGRPKKDDRWLLVALLVPISVFLVVMLALGIVYCTRCGARAKSRSVTQCYRWVISTSEKTAPPASSRLCQPATCRTSV
ncbi:endosialin-like [Crotalus adamanteus]|uniref:Endosialin-like n=1 Tax=Crotalus adamanteus TaxID=8729 RepID=A0AAW1ANW5_CROAD